MKVLGGVMVAIGGFMCLSAFASMGQPGADVGLALTLMGLLYAPLLIGGLLLIRRSRMRESTLDAVRESQL